MFEIVRQDIHRACRANQNGEHSFAAVVRELCSPGTQAIVVYRFGYWADNLRFAPARIVLRLVHFVVQYFCWRTGIFIPIKARIGPGLVIHTWGGGVFLPEATIGRDLTIVGGGVLFDYMTREIGDEVTIGAGTKSMGKIRIGHRVRTGPNSVIQEDVPDDCMVFGNPGRIIGPMPRVRRVAGGVVRPDAASGSAA